MMELWSELPAWLRLTIGLVLMIVGALIAIFVHIRIGLAMLAVGTVMMLVGGKTRAEKSGYNF
jgi:membrane protein implicated in regulation of membrane protease activity